MIFLNKKARMQRSAEKFVAQGKTSQAVGDLHYLFLIYDHAVGLFQDFLQFGEIVADFLFSLFARPASGRALAKNPRASPWRG